MQLVRTLRPGGGVAGVFGSSMRRNSDAAAEQRPVYPARRYPVTCSLMIFIAACVFMMGVIPVIRGSVDDTSVYTNTMSRVASIFAPPSHTGTASGSQTASPSATPSVSPPVTVTPPKTQTPSVSHTAPVSISNSAAASPTRSSSHSASASASSVPTPPETQTPSKTAPPTHTATSTPDPSVSSSKKPAVAVPFTGDSSARSDADSVVKGIDTSAGGTDTGFSASGEASAVHAPPAPENNNAADPHGRRHLWPPPVATPYPVGYISKLVRAARELGLTDSDIPDVYKRGRENSENGCPPYIGGALKDEDRVHARPTLDGLAGVTVSLITVSHRTPLSLANSVKRWASSGLLDMVDEKVMFLNAAQQEELELGAAYGFKLLTADQRDIDLLMSRHRDAIFVDAGNEMKDNFPYVQKGKTDDLQSLWVAPSLLFALHESAAKVTIFLEKDYATNPKLDRRELMRQLLAGVATLMGDTAVVRLRDLHDPDRSAIVDCCKGECGNGFSDFATTCDWSAHLNWLKMFCDPENIESSSKGNVKRCLDERGATQEVADARKAAPSELLCVSFDHSGWSNNAAMFTKHWWLKVLTSPASLTNDGNGMFEINAMRAGCRAPWPERVRRDRNWIAPGERAPFVCQLWPGIVVQEEIDGR